MGRQISIFLAAAAFSDLVATSVAVAETWSRRRAYTRPGRVAEVLSDRHHGIEALGVLQALNRQM